MPMRASERHDYRYTETEMQAWANRIFHQQANFDELYIYFENTVCCYRAVHNIVMLRQHLEALGMKVFSDKKRPVKVFFYNKA